QGPHRSAQKARNITATELGIAPDEDDDQDGDSDGEENDDDLSTIDSEIQETDPYFVQVRQLLNDGYAGVIFAGPPGTSKTYYAHNIAVLLAQGDPRRLRILQFHPSYQYEDFVEGYVPRRNGEGFRLRRK